MFSHERGTPVHTTTARAIRTHLIASLDKFLLIFFMGVGTVEYKLVRSIVERTTVYYKNCFP